MSGLGSLVQALTIASIGDETSIMPNRKGATITRLAMNRIPFSAFIAVVTLSMKTLNKGVRRSRSLERNGNEPPMVVDSLGNWTGLPIALGMPCSHPLSGRLSAEIVVVGNVSALGQE
jgi:hypothetical protein